MRNEPCKTCRKGIAEGIWLAPQFADENIFLFCSESCKEDFLRKKIARIKAEYPRYHSKILAQAEGRTKYKDMYLPFVEMMRRELEMRVEE